MGAQQARGALKHGRVGQSPIATRRVSARRDGVARRGSRDKQEKEAVYMDAQPGPESHRPAGGYQCGQQPDAGRRSPGWMKVPSSECQNLSKSRRMSTGSGVCRAQPVKGFKYAKREKWNKSVVLYWNWRNQSELMVFTI